MMEQSAYEKGKTRKLSPDEAKKKISRYCAYQERAHSEVESKLYTYGLNQTEVAEILAWLIAENFVNEERFAVAFAGGKFRTKRWGKIKIRQYLQQKQVSEYSINKALDLIDNSDYIKTINFHIDQAMKSSRSSNVYELRHKISRSLIAKGFEPELVWERLRAIIDDTQFS